MQTIQRNGHRLMPAVKSQLECLSAAAKTKANDYLFGLAHSFRQNRASRFGLHFSIRTS